MKINAIICGDVLTELKKLPDVSINCCITSPPYWGLRDYGTAEWEGGDENCEHIWEVLGNNRNFMDRGGSRSNRAALSSGDCTKCGAKRIDFQLGLEKTPEEYVVKMVEVFREVRRVLKKEGTFWLNLGDMYARSMKGSNDSGGFSCHSELQIRLKPKDLVGIPWRVAFALQSDGWYLRQDIIWHKPNPMPESVTDRCTKSHEYIFLMSKSQKYYFDNEAIKEKTTTDENRPDGIVRDREWKYDSKQKALGRYSKQSPKMAAQDVLGNPMYRGGHHNDGLPVSPVFRNKRSVWTITTKPFKEAHFATFPEDLIIPMVRAGCPPGGTVLDCFMGSGTTAVVARKLQRNYVGIELNPDYIKIANKRLSQQLLI